MKPILNALLVADHVYEDVATKKKIVAGIFHKIYVLSLAQQRVGEGDTAKVITPIHRGGMQAGSPFCYISLTEIRGNQSFSLRYVHLDEDRVLFQTEFSIECHDPLETIELTLPLPTLPTTKPGTFALELLCNNEPLGSHRILVEELKQTSEEKDKDNGGQST